MKHATVTISIDSHDLLDFPGFVQCKLTFSDGQRGTNMPPVRSP